MYTGVSPPSELESKPSRPDCVCATDPRQVIHERAGTVLKQAQQGSLHGLPQSLRTGTLP